VPPEALTLAVAASVYPPAVAVVIALGHGAEVRLRVFLLVGAALLTVYATGVVMLLAFGELGLSGGHHREPSAVLEALIGLLLIAVAVRIHRRGGRASEHADDGPSRTDRYMQSRRLVAVLGLVLYVVPSPIYLAAVKSISDSGGSTAGQMADLAVVAVVMLWMIEVPMVMLLLFPARASRTLEAVNAWFALHGRMLAVVIASGAGLYLIAHGVSRLPS